MLLRTDGGVRVLRAKRVGMKRLLSAAVLLMIAVAFSSVTSILPAYADEQRPSAAAVDSASVSAASDLVTTAQSKTADASTATSESAPDDSAAALGQETIPKMTTPLRRVGQPGLMAFLSKKPSPS